VRAINEDVWYVSLPLLLMGPNCHLFYICKGVPGAEIETLLLEDGVLGCFQVIDEIVGKRYISDILIPYFSKRS
jgi:hypothetical protein